jgi:hypothetical protein
MRAAALVIFLFLVPACAHRTPLSGRSSRALIALVGSPTWAADLAELGERDEVAGYVREAEEACQADANLSQGDPAIIPTHDAVCIERARQWLKNTNLCGSGK